MTIRQASTKSSLAAMLLLGCAARHASSVAPSGDEAAIRAARAEQNVAIAAGDLDDIAAFWVEDVTLRAGLGYTLRGRAAYRAAFASDEDIVYERRTGRVQLSNPWPLAWEEGSWVGRQQSTGEELITGRYAAQWIKINGAWKIRSELFVALSCSGRACRWPVTK